MTYTTCSKKVIHLIVCRSIIFIFEYKWLPPPGFKLLTSSLFVMSSWAGYTSFGDYKSKNANYRLITAYLLLQVNLDKIMHARWDFDASSARTWRVSALDKHQNWSASALFCLNSRAQSKYAVVNLIHTQRKQTFLSFVCDKKDILVSLKVIKYYQQNVITRLENKSTLRSRKSNLRYANARVSTARDVRSAIVQK